MFYLAYDKNYFIKLVYVFSSYIEMVKFLVTQITQFIYMEDYSLFVRETYTLTSVIKYQYRNHIPLPLKKS